MTRSEFAKNIRIAVEQSASLGIEDFYESVPGRKPDEEDLVISHWFTDLDASDRLMVRALLERTARQATYNFFLVLDGLSAFDDSDPKGELELFYVRGEERLLLNDFNEQALSSLFKDVELE